MKKKNLWKNIGKGLCIFLGIILIGGSAFATWHQHTLVKQKDADITLKEAAIKTLTDEKETLETALADKEAYIDEFDTTLFAAKEEADFSQQNPDSSDPEEKEDTDEKEDSDKKNDKANTSYKKKFTSLYAPKKEAADSKEKVVYLTFDDGPSHNTPKVLDILDTYDVKATFFVVKTEDEAYIPYYKEIVDRGHTIAIHTASHKYKQIYASVDAYLEDFNDIYTLVVEETGVKPTLFRYPGGSTNCQSYACGDDIMKEMERRGFIYYDWNVSSGDGGNQATRQTIYDWVTTNASKRNSSVVLMHDSGGKAETVAALPSIIETLQDKGCEFRSLDETCTPVQFGK